MPGGSLLTIFRSKNDGRRSRSSPPTDRAIDWEELPPAYRPAGPSSVRTLPRQPQPPPLQQPAPRVSQTLKKEVQKMNKQSSVLLQLPPPRAMWRRSLEDLSPTKRREWLSVEDLQRKQMSVDIACAMPPDFFDHPPGYTSDYGEDISPMSDEDRRRAYVAASDQFTDIENFRREIARMPTFTPTSEETPRFIETEYQIISATERASPLVTIDTLLTHPMLRTSR